MKNYNNFIKKYKTGMKYKDHPCFCSETRIAEFLKTDMKIEDISSIWNLIYYSESMGVPYSFKTQTTYILNKYEEYNLFLKYNYAKKNIIEIINIISNSDNINLSYGQHKKELLIFEKYRQDSLAALVLYNLAYLRKTVKKFVYRFPLMERDLYSEAHLTLIQSIDNFDIQNNVLFSAYLKRAFSTQLKRFIYKTINKNYCEKEIDINIESCCLEEYSQYDIEDIRRVLTLNIAQLTDREKYIIEARFIEGHKLIDIGKEIGLTKERIRQIEKKALSSLRSFYNT